MTDAPHYKVETPTRIVLSESLGGETNLYFEFKLGQDENKNPVFSACLVPQNTYPRANPPDLRVTQEQLVTLDKMARLALNANEGSLIRTYGNGRYEWSRPRFNGVKV